jgi:hypothetical protein
VEAEVEATPEQVSEEITVGFGTWTEEENLLLKQALYLNGYKPKKLA